MGGPPLFDFEFALELSFTMGPPWELTYYSTVLEIAWFPTIIFPVAAVTVVKPLSGFVITL